MNGVAKNMTGLRFGRLDVISPGPPMDGQRSWMCRCACGATKTALGTKLRSGRVKSCGCLKTDNSRKTLTKHGAWGTVEYDHWISMRKRCRPSSVDRATYYNRGIAVCDRWLNSFENFLCDMGRRPDAGYSLDRIDNERGYEPGNVRWATREEQGNNRRHHVRLTVSGESLTAATGARKHNIPRTSMYRIAAALNGRDVTAEQLAGIQLALSQRTRRGIPRTAPSPDIAEVIATCLKDGQLVPSRIVTLTATGWSWQS